MSFLQKLRPFVERFPRLTDLYRYNRDLAKLSRSPIQTSQGYFFCGNEQMAGGAFEAEETGLIGSLLASSDVLIDIGANIGYYCCIALSAGKPVVAFEPIPSNLQMLYRNIQLNGWQDQIEVFPLALADRIGLMEIYGSGTAASLVKGWGGVSPAYKSFVPVSTLDGLVGHRFIGKQCLIIVDVEGAEYNLLKGANAFLQRTPKPMWMVEIAVTKHMPQGVAINPTLLSTFELFWKNGYDAWTINKGMRLLLHDEIRQMSQGGIKPYSGHNLLFIEVGKMPPGIVKGSVAGKAQ